MRIHRFTLLYIAFASSICLSASEPDSTAIQLGEVNVVSRQNSTRRLRSQAINGELISAQELTRAACCNLGESFTTNPSVDVSYNDAATGARQIKLLGLAGTYVQMLTENTPNFRGSAMPFGLSYIPGPWIQSISVSKGASSVKNGHESITGQINVELKKPQAEQEVAVNGYFDTDIKAELNANANIHLGKSWSTALLAHGENSFKGHDGNGDGFLDMPRVRQISGFNRWARMGTHYVFQGGIKFLNERRESGQHTHSNHQSIENPYRIFVRTNRWEGFTKNAYIFDRENDGNVAMIASGSYNSQRSSYGNKIYNVDQSNIYLSAMFERKWGKLHQLSAGLSFNYDNYNQHFRLTHAPAESLQQTKEIDATSGAYAQYTLNLSSKLLAMAGIRYDYSTAIGSMFCPRAHVRWNPSEMLTLHGSAGRGYRNAHALAENSYVLASSRQIIIEPNLHGEEAWNYGIGAGSTIHIANKPLIMNAEYYYTDFRHQLVVDFDTSTDEVRFSNLTGKSFSHTFQFDATYSFFKDFNFTAAYRYTDVRTDYGKGLVAKPLTSRNKGLFTASYTPHMAIWQFDITCSINGGGRMPTPAITQQGEQMWQPRYHAFAQLSAQATRNFRHWSIYIGGENLTAYRQKMPIIGAHNPWGPGFDATMVYAPVHGAIVYAGFRYTLKKY